MSLKYVKKKIKDAADKKGAKKNIFKYCEKRYCEPGFTVKVV